MKQYFLTLGLGVALLFLEISSQLSAQTVEEKGELASVETPIAEHRDTSDSGVQQDSDNSQGADFDEDFIKRYVDYRYIVIDRLDLGIYNNDAFASQVNRIKDKSNEAFFHRALVVRSFPNKTLSLLNEEQYSEAVSKTREAIKNYLNQKLQTTSPPWEENKQVENNDYLIKLLRYPANINVYIHLLGLASELNEDYDRALESYRIVYYSNEVAMRWTEARLQYSKKDRGRSFASVCSILQLYYRLTPQDVDSVSEKVKATEIKWMDNQKTDISTTDGIPIGLTDRKEREVEAIELYQIRDWCARFICPNILYKKIPFTTDDLGQYCMKRDDLGQYRVETVKLIRASYDQFMDFMEQEYEKAMQDGDEFVKSPENRFKPKPVKDNFTEAMTLLRKIKELPY